MTTSGLLQWETATNHRRSLRTGQCAYYVMSPFETLEAGTIIPPYVDSTTPVVATLFDLIPLVMQDRYLANPSVRRAYEVRLETLRRADLVLALSEHTRRDGIEHLGLPRDRVVVIGGGIDAAFTPAPAGAHDLETAQKNVPGLREAFVLCVTGADDNRKNVRGLLEAWARLGSFRRSHQLVVVCSLPEDQRRVWENHAQRVGLDPGEVLFTGYVPEHTLVALYRSARVCVAPSVYEGFGLPVAEAAGCRTPTVAARASSFPELIDDDDALFDPHDADDIARVIRRSLEEPAWRDHLAERATARAEEFTWAAVAERTLEAVDEQLPVRTAGRRLPRTRLALCSPLPPTPSGVADYTERLIRPLSQLAEVDLFVEGAFTRVPSDPANVARFSLETLGSRLKPTWYDCVIHVVGGSVYHREIVRVAEQVPGLVWLHDVRLGGTYITEADHRAHGDADSARALVLREIDRQYPRAPDGLRLAWQDSLAYDTYGVGMTRAVASAARGVLVNSEVAKAMFLADQPPDAPIPPVHVLPFGVPTPALPPTDRDPDLVVVLGQVSPVRMSELAVESIALLRRERPNARLVFVGNAPEEYAGLLRERAAAVAPGAVTILGEVPEQDYRTWVATAGAALQLRVFSRGESSATVADCLAVGTPVVTNVAACRELPPGAVHFLETASAKEAAEALNRVMARDLSTPVALPDFGDVATRLMAVVESLQD